MKILYISPHGEFTSQMKEAFAENGVQVIYLDDRKNYFMPSLLRGAFIWKLTRRIPYIRIRSNKILNQKAVKLSEEHRPDFLFTGKGMNIKASTVLKIKSLGIKTATWFMENTYQEDYFRWFSNNYMNYDYVFTNDSYFFDNFQGKSSARIKNVSMTIDPERYRKESLSEKDRAMYSCDICFVGAFDKNRERILIEISKINGINLKIFGWSNWKKSSLVSLYYGPLNLEQMVKLYGCAKICLNINGQNKSTDPVLNGVNLKTFEIPAASGFQISDYRKDVSELFEIGEEIEIFKNEDDLIDKIKFYLSHDKERNKITKAGHERVLRDHTLDKRVKEILGFIQTN